MVIEASQKYYPQTQTNLTEYTIQFILIIFLCVYVLNKKIETTHSIYALIIEK
jgi:hypothetical protein